MRKEPSASELRSRGDEEADPELPAKTGEADDESEVQKSDFGSEISDGEVDESGVEVDPPPTAPCKASFSPSSFSFFLAASAATTQFSNLS